MTARTIIEGFGLEYVGPQQRPNNKPPGHLFNVRNATLMLDEVTEDTLAAKLAEHEQRFIQPFMQIIRGQREEAELPEETLFYDLFCHECENQETDRMSLEAFARKVYELGWKVLSVERNQVECPECQNYEAPEASYAQQYQSGSGGLL